MRGPIFLVALTLTPGVALVAYAQGAPSAQPTVEPRVEQAAAAAKTMRERLTAALEAALKAGGPVKAVPVCADTAPAISAGLASDTLAIGRTSTRLRNEKNAPRPWVAPLLAQMEKTLPEMRGPLTAPLPDGSLGVVLPIIAMRPCLQCHGVVGADVKPETLAAIKQRYPKDAATGFKEGDLRGVFWVEVKPPKPPMPAPK